MNLGPGISSVDDLLAEVDGALGKKSSSPILPTRDIGRVEQYTRNTAQSNGNHRSVQDAGQHAR